MAAIVIAAALAFAQGAYFRAQRLADVALQIRQANTLMGYVLGTPLRAVGETSGQTRDFAWWLTLRETGDPGRVEICRRTVKVRSLKAPTRLFEAAGLEPCPPKAAA